MALPAALIKAKNGIKKAAAGMAAKSAGEEVEEGAKKGVKFSLLGCLPFASIIIIILMIFLVAGIMFSQTLYTMFPAVASASETSDSTDFTDDDTSDNNGSTSGNSGSAVVDCARGALGVPYVFGGTNYKKGMDCSGLVYVCYKKALGVTVGRSTSAEYNDSKFKHVSSIDQLVAGDLIQPKSGHVVIYTGKETNTIIHEPHSGSFCKELSLDDYYKGSLKKKAYAYLHYRG